MDSLQYSREELANVTWPAYKNETFAFILTAVIACPIGIPANFIVLFLSFKSPLLVGDYKYFFANLSICGLLFCFNHMFQLFYHLYHEIWGVPMSVISCTIQTEFTYATGLCFGYGVGIISINRYCIIVLNHKQWFSKWRNILYCLPSYIPFVYPIVDLLFAKYAEKEFHCSYSLFIPSFRIILSIVTNTVPYLAAIFCTFKTYRFISRYIHGRNIGGNVSASQIQNEKSILKAIVLHGIVPIVCAAPVGVIYFVTNVALNDNSWNAFSFKVDDFFMLSAVNLGKCVFALAPTFDAIITLGVVKPYNKAFMELKSSLGIGLNHLYRNTFTNTTEVRTIMTSL